jgi:hypothetical protein
VSHVLCSLNLRRRLKAVEETLTQLSTHSVYWLAQLLPARQQLAAAAAWAAHLGRAPGWAAVLYSYACLRWLRNTIAACARAQGYADCIRCHAVNALSMLLQPVHLLCLRQWRFTPVSRQQQHL